MIELTNVFRAAQEKIDCWSEEDFKSFLYLVCQAVDNSVVDWEAGDEEWGRVILDSEPIVLVCAKIPLALFLKRYEQKFR